MKLKQPNSPQIYSMVLLVISVAYLEPTFVCLFYIFSTVSALTEVLFSSNNNKKEGTLNTVFTVCAGFGALIP